jgi:hypothetical protein
MMQVGISGSEVQVLFPRAIKTTNDLKGLPAYPSHTFSVRSAPPLARWRSPHQMPDQKVLGPP